MKGAARLVWKHLFLLALVSMYAYYYTTWRYNHFIDSKNHTLHSYTYLKEIDLKIRQLAIENLREKVFKDEPTVDSLAGLLYRLVTEDQQVKDLFAGLFVDLLKREDFTRDTYSLVDNSIHKYLDSQLAVKHLSMIVTEKVL